MLLQGRFKVSNSDTGLSECLFSGLAFPVGIGAAFIISPAKAHIAIYFGNPEEKVTALSYWGAAGFLGFMSVFKNRSDRCLAQMLLCIVAWAIFLGEP